MTPARTGISRVRQQLAHNHTLAHISGDDFLAFMICKGVEKEMNNSKSGRQNNKIKSITNSLIQLLKYKSSHVQ